MDKLDQFTKEIIMLLHDMEPEEIRELVKEWVTQMAGEGCSSRVINYCSSLAKMVIDGKESRT